MRKKNAFINITASMGRGLFIRLPVYYVQT